VHNEKCKLIAGAFDRLSTGFVLAGVFAPLYAISQGQPAPTPQELIGMACWFFGALVLHLRAQVMIGRMVE
jgi:hypothetical protein